jgi:hypothetical protein
MIADCPFRIFLHLRQTWHPIFQMIMALTSRSGVQDPSLLDQSSGVYQISARDRAKTGIFARPSGSASFFAWSDYASGRREERSHCAAKPNRKAMGGFTGNRVHFRVGKSE